MKLSYQLSSISNFSVLSGLKYFVIVDRPRLLSIYFFFSSNF
uniref:Uncharacterized protein n=1 Tax=Anguilla anguilla TaxID=7936 RepID=A0A0E9U3I9_ANGAN